MTIHVDFTGQLGNCFFTYCLGKILAEKTGQDYVPPFPHWITKAGGPVKYSTEIPFIAQPVPTIGRGSVSGPTQHYHSLHWVDVDGFSRDRPIHVSSYAQRYQIFQPWKDRIRNDWLKIREDAFVETDPECVYIHVRRTDYVGNNLNPDQQCIAHTIPEYLRCLEEFPNAKLATIITDDPHDPFIAALRKTIAERFPARGCSSVSSAWDRDFMTLASAKSVIISQSTYAWWACWLGRAEKVVCPIGVSSLWHRGMGLMGAPKPGCGDYPNLYPHDEKEKWFWIET
jgi:hypothetical protein